MATYTPKVLYFGQLNNSMTSLLAPSGKQLHIHNILLYNSGATAEIVEFDYNDGVTTCQTYKLSVGSGATVNPFYTGEGDIVEDGHILRGKSTLSSVVTIKICGSEVV